MPPRDLAEALAKAKAGSDDTEGIVIGSDQVAALGDEILGKPGTVDAAISQLQLLNGREHQLITALAVRHRGRTIVHTDVTTLTMRGLSSDSIRRYVEADRPIDCAGSYKIESKGIALFERIESADQSAIIGLPLITLTTILRSLGVDVP